MSKVGIYGMDDWDIVLSQLSAGAFVRRSRNRYALLSPHPDDARYPGAHIAGLTAPLYHALGDAGALVMAPHSDGVGYMLDTYIGAQRKPVPVK